MRIFELKKEIRALADPARAKVLARFFKTGLGEYGEGDVFLGLTVPQSRVLARRFVDVAFADISKLLTSPVHEERLIALLILVARFQKGDAKTRDEVYRLYIRNAMRANNWDLVDLSADKIVGAYLLDRPKAVLYRFAKSKNIWERRIAIISTFYFIRNGRYIDTIAIAEKLLSDDHDLIHKAVGWMLREVGKRSVSTLTRFLDTHASRMPRTMLRYAIERLPEVGRRRYLAVKPLSKIKRNP